MSTTGELVEITPELLEGIEEAVAAIEQSPSIMGAIPLLREYRQLTEPPVVLALVARIRELESEREKEDGYRDGSVLSRP